MPEAAINRDGYFHFDPDDPVYADHFPGNPVVPGSLIIDAFVSVARTSMAGQGGYVIENFRFKQFIGPGRYAFRLESQADGGLRCRLFEEDRAVVTGTIRTLFPGN